MIPELVSEADRIEVALFVGALVVALFLGATGPWQVGAGVTEHDPCGVSQGTDYVPARGPVAGPDDLGRAVVYVTEYDPTGKRDCIRRSLDAGEATTVSGVRVRADEDGSIRVGGTELAAGEVWQTWATERRLTDPWYDRHRNLVVSRQGTVEGVETAAGTARVDHDVVLITGSASTRKSLNPITAAVFLSATFLVIGIPLEWSVRVAGVDFGDVGADRSPRESDETRG